MNFKKIRKMTTRIGIGTIVFCNFSQMKNDLGSEI